MRGTSEDLPKPFKNHPLEPKIKTLAKSSLKTEPFLDNFCVATSQSWGSNPDRSPVAQWSNMRISPASLPPGVHSKPVPGPALAESPVRRGRFSEITILAEIPLYSKPLGPASAASPVRRGRFSETTIMGPWDHGTMGPWDHGAMGPWDHGTMGPWDHGTMGPWDQGPGTRDRDRDCKKKLPGGEEMGTPLGPPPRW